MKKWVFLALYALLSGSPRVCGQNRPVLAPVHKTSTPTDSSAFIPSFSIDLYKGNKHMTKADLNPQKPLMIVYYSPTCEHCQQLGDSLAANLHLFNGVQVVMVTFRPNQEVGEYVRLCHLGDAPFFIGTEGLTFTVAKHYGVQTFPFIAVYNKHQRLIAIFRRPPMMKVLHHALFSERPIPVPVFLQPQPEEMF